MRIALFQNHPQCSRQCCDGMIKSLSPKYQIDMMTLDDMRQQKFKSYDCIAFPGGIGDYSSYDSFFRRKTENAVADFVANGGYYLGICMGAYWAGPRYFDILKDATVEQYIKRPTADIKRPYGTVAKVLWNGQNEYMFFYDGGTIITKKSDAKYQVKARYKNGDPMAIMQDRLGLIGCHPESEPHWYKSYSWMRNHYHNGEHHKLLLNFVDELMYGKQEIL